MNRKSKKAAEPEVKRNEIIEALEALEQSLTGEPKTIILDKDSPLAQILLGK
jgi:hypothetical protein